MTERFTARPGTYKRSRISASAMIAGVALFLGFLPSARAQAVLSITPAATAGTIAGTGTAGYSGDNGAATGATLASPSAVAYDSNGDLFIADTRNNVIREVSASGVVTTVAGNGQQGFSGDGAAATSAELNAPTGIAIDANGNLYIADSGNDRIREVSNGIISTVAGNGMAGYSGDGGAATSAELDLPMAVAVDSSGNLYLADTDNQRIREVSKGVITTIAGDGEQGFGGDGGPAINAELDTPTGIAVDASGNIFIADSHNNRIREVSNGNITTAAGSGPDNFSGGYSGDGGLATAARLAKPSGVAIDPAGNIYIADTNNNRLREVGNGSITTIAGSGAQGFGGDGGAAASAILNAPRGAALNSTGDVVVADSLNERIRSVNLPALSFGSQDIGLASSPQYVTIANSGSGTLSVQSLNIAGNFAAASGGTCPTLPISLTSSQSCTEAIVFEPASAGPAQGSLVVSGSGVVPETILLSGTGSTAGQPSVSPASLSLGGLVVGQTSSAQTVTLANGNQPLTINGIAASTDFGETNNCPPVLAASGSCAISVTFTPKAGGASSGTLTITDNASNSPQSVSLAGIGQDFKVGSFTTSETVLPGAGTSYLLSIKPEGGFSGAVSLACSGAPANATCTVEPNSVPLSGSSYAAPRLQIRTTAPSALIPLTPEKPILPPARWFLVLWIALAASFGFVKMAAAKRSRPGFNAEFPAADLWLLTLPSRRRHLSLVSILAGLLMLAAFATSCGVGASSIPNKLTGGTPAGTYTLTVTGTSGNLSHSATVTLVVK